MINRLLLLQSILQKYELSHIQKYDGPIFNHLDFNTINQTCKNLLNENNQALYYYLDIFSKKHHNNSSNLYRNLLTLNVKLDEKMLPLARYRLEKKENILTYRDETSIYHELLHVATAYNDYENNVYYRGFFQDNENNRIMIGEGLNEGYTELLANRDINDGNYINYNEVNNTYISSYPISQALTHQLEIIIGKDKMEQMYFNNDLKELINQLLKYNKTEVEVFNFLKYFDLSIIVNKNTSKIITNKIVKAQSFLRDICETYYPERIDEFEKHELIDVKKIKQGSILPRQYLNELIKIEEKNYKKNG